MKIAGYINPFGVPIKVSLIRRSKGFDLELRDEKGRLGKHFANLSKALEERGHTWLIAKLLTKNHIYIKTIKNADTTHRASV